MNYRDHCLNTRIPMRRPNFSTSRILAPLASVLLSLTCIEPANGAEIAACHDTSSADCLIDVGVALYLEGAPEIDDPRGALGLIALGRIDEARAISSTMKDLPPVHRLLLEEAFARLELQQALAQGGDLREILRQIPDINAGQLHLTELNLLGQDVDGFPANVSLRAPGPPEHAMVAEIATLIVELAGSMRADGAGIDLAHAANLFAELGDTAGVRRAVALLPPGNGPVRLSQRAFEVGGVDELLTQLDRLGAVQPTDILRAAGAAQDSNRAMALIKRAYTMAKSQEPWPDFEMMKRAVDCSAELGHVEQAMLLARDMAKQAFDARSPFAAFDNLDAAHALLVAGAERDEVVASLDRAEGFFPTDPDAQMAFGLVGGPMRWEASGLKDEAMAKLAYLSARLGELDRAKRALAQVDDPMNWHGLDDASMQRPAIDAILDFAAQRLPPDEHAFLVSQTIRMAVTQERPEADHAWALRRARLLFEAGGVEEKHAGAVHTAIAIVAWQTGDEVLKAAVLSRMAQWALDTHDPADILTAGILFEVLGPAPENR
jgi:hypothetical protein